MRAFRLDDARWAALKAQAASRGISVSELLREIIDAHLRLTRPQEHD